MPTVLFLCTGNYYRSRFAELLFNSLAAGQGLGWSATSRGLALERGAHNVGPISKTVLRTLKELGVSIADEHRLPDGEVGLEVRAGGHQLARGVLAASRRGCLSRC